jgi:hypothetical protein
MERFRAGRNQATRAMALRLRGATHAMEQR